ncbi:plasmalemma vesicle-associated protein isoform X2 [Pelodiscus sinensis]|uniref:plasmalemma vesicle-associated protein isoform X2 n=1 Tax=Pelodiscus sinensis TaxID=13735 RepID=UPI003F6CF8A6
MHILQPQFLIILGLVLFMIYGNAHAGTDTHLRHLEEQVQELYGKVMELNMKNRNLTLQLNATTKEKLTCFQMKVATQKELEKCNNSLRACSSKELQYQGVIDYAVVLRMTADECLRNMNLLNVTCYAEKLSLREARDRLLREAQQQRENCSQMTETLKQAASAAGREREQCRLQTIDLRAQYNGLVQSQEECCNLGMKVTAEIEAARKGIQASLDKTMASYQPSDCATLPQLVNTKLQSLGDTLQREMKDETQARTRLHGEKMSCDMKLQDSRQQSNMEIQGLRQQLQALQTSCDAEVKRSFQEKQALAEEKGRLSQQLQEWSKVLAQAEDMKAQLESCRKSIVFPGNPALRIPANPGVPGNPPFLRNPGIVRNPSILGNPGTFGNLDRTSLEAWRQRILEEAKQPNQVPRKPLEQPSG